MVLHRKIGTGQTDVLVALSWISFFQKLSRVSHLERKSYGYRISQSLEVALHGSGRASKSDASKHGSSLVPTCRRALSELRDSKWFQDIPVWKILCYPFVIYCALFSSNFQLLNSLQVPVISGDLLQNQRQAQPHSKTLSVHLGAAGSLWVMQCICIIYIICICIICIRFDAMPIAMAKLLSEIPNERTE
jgi:hypothetical protein